MKRTTIGLLITIAYLTAFFVLCYIKWSSLASANLDQLGTFLGGVFSPIAFLWLVLGYLQQGDELRQNTRALEMQAEELRHSVQHQGDMVNLTRSQVQAELAREDEERQRIAAAARPIFRFSSGGGSSSGRRIEARLIGSNVGNTAVDIEASLDPPMEAFSPRKIVSWERAKQITFSWQVPEPWPEQIVLTLSFNDSAGAFGTSKFSLTRIGDAPTSWQAKELPQQQGVEA